MINKKPRAFWVAFVLFVPIAAFGQAASSAPNRVVDAVNYPGADMGARIANALRTVYKRGGGTVDARGFSCPQQCRIGTANLVVGDGKHSVKLLLPYGVITRGLVAGKDVGTQILYNSNTTIVGQGEGATVIKGPSDVTAVQQAFSPSGQISHVVLEDFSIHDTGPVKSGSAALQVSGPVPGSGGGTDVLSSVFKNLTAAGADIGVHIDSPHGCTCYNRFYNLDASGRSIGVYTENDSGYPGGFNSNQWYGGLFWAPIGLLDAGGGKDTFFEPDMEGNRSRNGGGVLAAEVTNNNAGSGYKVGDIVRPVSMCATRPTFEILHVNSAGSVGIQGHPALRVATPGAGCLTNVSADPVIGGHGAGLKVNMQTSAYMVLLADGDMVDNPYEEAGAEDFICGTDNEVVGTMGSSNGTTYTYALCPGTTGGYGGPAANFTWGTGATPASIGLRGRRAYIAFASPNMFDARRSHAYRPVGSRAPYTVNLYPNGPVYNGFDSLIYGPYGYSTWNEGLNVPHSGISSTGKVTIRQLGNPKAPVLSASAFEPGDAGKRYSYAVVCSDRNGGKTLPSAFARITGPSVLGAILTARAREGGSGYEVGDIVTVDGGNRAGRLTVTAVGARGLVTGISVKSAGNLYDTLPSPGTGHSSTFPASGGSGSGLTVTLTATYVKIAYPSEQGCSWTVLKGNVSNAVPGKYPNGSTDAAADRVDFGAATVTYTPPTRNSTGDETVAGNLAVKGSTTIGGSAVASASQLPLSGSLTTTAAAFDTLKVAGLTPRSHCVFSATNTAAAADVIHDYISAVAANSVTLAHTAIAGMAYDFVCTVN